MMSLPNGIMKCIHFNNPRDELGRALQKLEMEKKPRSASAIEKHRKLTEQQPELKALVPGILLLMRSSRGDKSMEFINRDFNAAIHISRCAVLNTRPEKLTRFNSVGQPLILEASKKKRKSIAGGQLKKIGKRLRAGRYIYPSWWRTILVP